METAANMYHNASAFTDLVTSASTSKNSVERMGEVNPVQESPIFRSVSSTLSAPQVSQCCSQSCPMTSTSGTHMAETLVSKFATSAPHTEPLCPASKSQSWFHAPINKVHQQLAVTLREYN